MNNRTFDVRRGVGGGGGGVLTDPGCFVNDQSFDVSRGCLQTQGVL